MFDPKAPIEQQFTRDGRKVLAIYDSGLRNLYPIAAWDRAIAKLELEL